MKLGARLALAAVLAELPVVGALVLYDAHERRRTAEEILAEHALNRLQDHRDDCEQDPARWNTLPPPERHRARERRHPSGDEDHAIPPPPPPSARGPRGRRDATLFAYDVQMHSQTPGAPELSTAWLKRLDGHPYVALPQPFGSDVVEVLARSEWGTGSCAIVYARGSTAVTWLQILPRSWIWLLPVVAVFSGMLMALWPVVRRIGALRNEVARSLSGAHPSPIVPTGNDEVTELAQAFEDARRDIAERAQERDAREEHLRTFLANTTHDVMTPLTVLLGHLSALRSQLRTQPQVAIVGDAINEAQYMTSLLQNLATVARLESTDGPFSRAPVELGALVQRVVARHGPSATARGISLNFSVPDMPVQALADVTLLEQAVGNLVHNAVRYNHAQGHVAVVLEAQAGRFELRVSDDGPGIAESELRKVTQRGTRGDAARSRAPEGLGLGLSIAQRVVDAHEMSLLLYNAPEGGLTAQLRGALMQGTS